MTYIFGTGGNATAIFGMMADLNLPVSGFLVDKVEFTTFHGFDVMTTDSMTESDKPFDCIVSVGENFARELVVKSLIEKFQSRISFPSLVHPTAHVSRISKIGFGSILFAGAKVGAQSIIGNFAHLNTNSSIDHDNQISNFVSLAPGSVTGGNVRIGTRSALLINSAVSNKILIGSDVVLAGASFLKENTQNNQMWAGSPAEFKRSRDSSENYL